MPVFHACELPSPDIARVSGHVLDTPAAAAFRSFSRWVAEEVDRPSNYLLGSRSVAASVERTLLAMLVDCLRDCAPQGRCRVIDPAEACVRRLEEWMDEKVGEPVGIEDFASHAGVSVRTVQTAFRRLRGCTPTQAFIRRRLERARQLLLVPEPSTTVTSVASDCGFFQFGRFAVRYRDVFGESPSSTLEQARRQVGLWAEPEEPSSSRPPREPLCE